MAILLRTVRVLIVEDQKKVAKALRDGLEAEHYEVRVASTGEEGFFLVNHESFDWWSSISCCRGVTGSRSSPPSAGAGSRRLFSS